MTVYIVDGVSLEDALSILRTGTDEDMRRYRSCLQSGNAHGNRKTIPAGASPGKDNIASRMTKKQKKKEVKSC